MCQEYLVLFSALSNAIEHLDAMKQMLILAQQRAEEIYIERKD